ncbi:MAG: outer membrane beta-barrel protein [Bacteroidota bacterium]
MTHNLKLKLLLLLICLQGYGIAQKTKPVPRWRLQATAGATFNYFTDEQPHTGMDVGATAQFRLNYSTSKHFSLYAETGYVAAGGSLTKFTDNTWLGFDPTITFKNAKQSNYLIHSLESSVGAAYSIVTKGLWSVKVYVAPTLNITTGETENYEKTGNLISGVSNSPGVVATINGNQYVDKFKPYWWSATGGLQIGLPVKKSQEILIDFRYVWGLSPVLDDYSYIGTSGVSGNIRTSSFRLGLGYSIPAFGKKNKPVSQTIK